MNIWLLAIILGLVEGITEFIPVSSTGHLLLAENLLGVKDGDFFTTDLFNSFIQVWALLAALPLFRERLATITKWREPKYRDYFVKLAVAFVITGVGGLAMKKAGLELDDKAIPILIALFVGGTLFIGVERWLRGREGATEITWTVAIAIGLAQLVAVAFPGTSRSGVTILVALMLGIARPAATEFSFLLGVPTLGAAGAKTLLDALKAGGVKMADGSLIPINWGVLALSSLVAAISSVFAVRWMIRYVQTHTFTGFGWYRIGLAAVLLGFYLAGLLH